ncbi:APC family permease [uncultured Anaeromusa sp.]|uniref:APC family permease n=1 Tax=uncultured Anaeromusa sp. TaxID=673273 RepID=UPI0029C90EF5|nr:APC family permease [uncultured Anaeromusa sp.]
MTEPTKTAAPALSQAGGPGLKRVLTLRQLVWFGLSYLAPIGIFTQFGVLTGVTHGMTTLSYSVAMAVILLTALSYAKLSAVFPVAGSAYTYVQRAVNPHAGFLTGWMLLLDYLLLPMVCVLLLGLFLHKEVPAAPAWVWIFLSVLIIAFINSRGIEPTVAVNTWTVLLQAAFSLLFLFVAVRLLLSGGGAESFLSWEAIYNPAEFERDSFLLSVGTLTIAFLGFDAVTTLAEETLQPEKTVGRALLLICLIAGVFFILISYLCQLAWPSGWKEITDPNTGFFEIALHLQADYMQPLYAWISNLASLTCAIAGQAAAARLLFGMGRDGALPKSVFAYVHPRWRTPIPSILLVSLLSLSAVLFTDSLLEVMALISFGALAGFAMVNLAVIFYFYRKKNRYSPAAILEYLLCPLLGAGCCLYFLWFLPVAVKLLGLSWLGLGIFYLAFMTHGFRRQPPGLKLE